jgi:large subunit ribosomal protein L18
MARNSRYRVPLRRRREGKTDYQARTGLVLSRRPRLVARGTLKNAIAQIIIAKPHGDEILVAAHSKELQKFYGWKAPTGNIPAAYLTGLLCGLKAKAKGVNEAVLDIGLVSPSKGSLVFAIMNGVNEGGVNVPHDEAKIVKERTKGEHIAKYAKTLGPDNYGNQFSKYKKQEIAPEKLPEHFTKVKSDIISSFKTGGKKS